MSHSDQTDNNDSAQWNVFFRADKISKLPKTLEIEALEDDMSALAAWLHLKSISNLHAEVTLVRPKGNFLIKVKGKVYADIEQECVRSFDVVKTSVEEEFTAYFTDQDETIPFAKGKHDLLVKYGQDEVPMLDEKDDPEPLENGVLNIGALASQFLVLGIPLYPRLDETSEIEGTSVVFDDDIQTSKNKCDVSEKYSPFSELANWRSQVNFDEDKPAEDAANEEDES